MIVRGWPRTIRSQLLSGFVLLEALSLLLFVTLLLRQQSREIFERAQQRLRHQATSLSVQAVEALKRGSAEGIVASVSMMGEAPSVESAKITDPAGKILYVNDGEPGDQTIQPEELAQIAKIQGDAPRFFALGSGAWEGLKVIRYQGRLFGYAWVKTDRSWDREQLTSTLRSSTVFGVIWISASILLAWGLSRSITRPLALLHQGTRALMHAPENHEHFPLPVNSHNEIGELIVAFNRMVASIEEQRSGLSDTLALLDSMLANAPIGLAFFDRRCRFVRVNRIFADTTGIPLSRHLGRTLPEILPLPVAHLLEEAIHGIFERNEPIRDLEIDGPAEEDRGAWTWIASAYPVHTHKQEVRWVGLIVMDASDRKRSEEALRKTEKLAATGRLAASIAHEINNPLEAITNLLYLLSNHAELTEPARSYVEMAEHEVRRISEITQQTLRFYRQSTLPARTNLAELLDSVLRLYLGRLRNLQIELEKRYDSRTDLFCFSGELRQVFANLIGNAIDAMPSGGRLLVRARRSRDWREPEREGVRFLVADTGSGMAPAVQRRIFEPFYTTKEVTGTGLGLWVSSEIVAKHQGKMRVRSRPETHGGDSGTVFELFFPDELNLAPVLEESSHAASMPV